MTSTHQLVDDNRALKHLMDLLAVEGSSGREGKIAAAVRKKLLAAGCKTSWIRHDQAHRKIPGFEVGNLIVRVPGLGQHRSAPRRLFIGHLDTVPLCRGAVPVRRGGRIVPKGRTGLGADNRTSVAGLVTLVECLLKHKLPRPPITVLLTVGEELGLRGSSHLQLKDLGRPESGFNIDSGDPRKIIVGATGADRWEVDVIGQSSHAGVHPADGVSAIVIASRAIETIVSKGFFGEVVKGRRRGTSNVGVVEGGEVTNQVTDYVFVRGESRSHDRKFKEQITATYRRAFEAAARSVRNRKGKKGKVRFRASVDYESFHMDENSPVVRRTVDAVKALRLRPELVTVDGGVDANPLNQQGVPTVTLGAGQHHPHTLDEYVDIKEYLTGCRLVVGLAAER